MRKTVLERYLGHVEQRGPDECWRWKSALFNSGPGSFFLDGAKLAHHVGFRLHNLREPVGHVIHTCSNSWCQNPRHWVEGTLVEAARYRRPRSGVKPMSAAERADVLRLTADGLSIGRVAEAVRRSRTSVSRFLRGKSHTGAPRRRPGPSRRLTARERERILGLLEQGLSQDAVALKLKVGQGVISRLVREWRGER